ncbi:MAG: AraC family ligand binding domain-containing protein [Arenicella sp.]
MSKQKNNAKYSYAHDLGGLEILHAKYESQCFSRHVHEGFCIGVIETGAQRFYCSGENHLAAQDSIIFVNSDQVHDGHKATDYGWSYRAMYPMPEMLAEISCELKSTHGGTHDRIPWFADAVVKDTMMSARLKQLFSLLENSDNQLERESLYLNTIIELICRHGRQHNTLLDLGKEPTAVQRVRDYIDAHFEQNISIQTLANLVQLSPFYLTRLFHKTVGSPPHAYQIQRRLFKAKRLIVLGVKLSDVAADCGFSDQSHLSRHFKKSFVVAPGAFQRMVVR